MNPTAVVAFLGFSSRFSFLESPFISLSELRDERERWWRRTELVLGIEIEAKLSSQSRGTSSYLVEITIGFTVILIPAQV